MAEYLAAEEARAEIRATGGNTNPMGGGSRVDLGLA